MVQDPDTSGRTHQDCGASDAGRAASSEHSQIQVPSAAGQNLLQPTTSTARTIKTAEQITNAAMH